MEDIVLNHRVPTPRDTRLRSLIALLTTDELDEAINLIEDLMADRQRPARAEVTAEPTIRTLLVAD